MIFSVEDLGALSKKRYQQKYLRKIKSPAESRMKLEQSVRTSSF